MATLTINGRSVSADPNRRSSTRPAQRGSSTSPPCAGTPSCRSSELPYLPGVGGGAGEVAPGLRHQGGGRHGWCRPNPTGRSKTAGACLRLLLERYPGEHLRTGAGEPPATSRGVCRALRVVPTPLGERDLPPAPWRRAAGDSMIRHDMSTCILCTRCVRACEDIQVVGVLDVASGRAHRDHRRSGRRPGQGGMHVVRRVRARLPDGRDLRGDAARALRTGASPSPRKNRRLGLPVLRRRVPGDAPRRRRQGHPGHLPDIELDTPNQGSTCVKGRFGYDFPSTTIA